LRDGESGIQTSNVDGESTATARRSDAKGGIENDERTMSASRLVRSPGTMARAEQTFDVDGESSVTAAV